MARKGWDALSPGYRARIEKSGMTRGEYEAGHSLQKARGHEKTPERPKQYDAQKYKDYHAQRARLTREVERKKEQMFGQSPKWNAARSQTHMTEKPPSLAAMRWALNASDEDILDAIREDYETYSFLGYG